MKHDVAIIGAGLSGLAAGIRLAHFDYKVCIFEKHSRAGGLNSYYSRNGRDYDVGLHAVTNYPPAGAKSTPLPRVLRQLRLSADQFALAPQVMSEIRFPGRRLRFTNDFSFFEGEIAREFPSQIDGFRRLVQAIREVPDLNPDTQPVSARKMAGSYLTDSLLIEMLFCPLMFYGSATEHDVDSAQFTIMFKSIFMEGLARPYEGVRRILSALLDRYQSAGGELRLRCGVRRIQIRNGRAMGLTLENGETIEAGVVFSSAGHPETMALCEGGNAGDRGVVGAMSFIEAVCSLDAEPASFGHTSTVVFFSDSDTFSYRKPAELVDLSSGVICCPNNFQYGRPLGEGVIRLTHIANYDRWKGLSGREYLQEKQKALETAVASAERFVPSFGGRIVATDLFTPKTLRRFTSRLGGAIYGSPVKSVRGTTPYENLYICGTDQGYVGIVGAMLSGIAMANNHVIYKGRN